MAEVASKKSIKVVSSKKSEVCSVQSNNGLIDLDNITTSNNELISLCDNNDDDDDLILTNNTRNELDSDDKSLQELIESELALRICSSNEEEPVAETEDREGAIGEQIDTVKRIVLDRREDPLDVNAEFILAETKCSALEEERAYGYQNGHASPSMTSETVKPEPPVVDYREEQNEEVLVEQSDLASSKASAEDRGTDEALLELENDRDQWREGRSPVEEQEAPLDPSSAGNEPSEEAREPEKESFEVGSNLVTCVDKHEQEETIVEDEVYEDLGSSGVQAPERSDLEPATADLLGTWTERTSTEEGHQAGQFSDNFDETLCQQDQDTCEVREEEPAAIEPHDEQKDLFKPIEVTELEESTEPKAILDEPLDTLSNPDHDKLINLDEDPTPLPDDKQDTHEDPPSAQEEPTEQQPEVALMESRSFEETTEWQSKISPDAISTEEFIDVERRVLAEEYAAQTLEEDPPTTCTASPERSEVQTEVSMAQDDAKEEANENVDDQNLIAESSSELSVSESTFIEKTEVVVSDSSVTIFSETKCVDSRAEECQNLDSWTTVEEATKPMEEQPEEEEMPNIVEETVTADSDVNDNAGADDEDETRKKQDCLLVPSSPRAPLATPDDETSDVSNACDSESREETITSSSVMTTTNVKGGAKTKKKKIEGVVGNDASPNLTPRTKKTKKSKKSDLEKENISVKSSFNKFDALSKKTVLHVRSVDASKVQQQLNAVGQNGDTNPNCRSCGKVVFQMEQTKAEGLIWHKNCFRCVQCSKQLNVDNYESHESTLYCKPHFKELFQPKPVEESDQPASDKPDLGLQELSSLNVKSRFQVFEKAGAETGNEIERSPSQIAVKRSPSILSKLAKFQAKGMDIGVADESLNGIPYEESSESEEEEEIEETEEVETEIVKAKRATRERPISFSKMDDIKNRWESTSQQGRREVQREARKEEIAGIRSRLFMGKQGKMKEMYQQAVAGSERVTKINAAEEIQHSTHARSIKERFERGEPIAASDDEIDSKPKPEKADEEVIAAGISRKSRSLFLELDATAAKTGRPVTPVNPKTPAEAPRRARDMDLPDREIYRDPEVVRAEDRVDEVVHTDTARKMLSIFRQMEENAGKKELPNLGGPKPLKRFTPPPEDKFAKPSASDSEEEEEEGEESEADDSNEERDPNYVRASDKVEDEFLKQAQNAARAKTLCAKFEHWEETDGKPTSNPHIAEMEIAQGTGEQSSIESASSLRARFESLGSQPAESPRTPKVKVNRFVEIQTSCMDVCESCEKKVYPLEKVETNNKIFHKQCFRCLQCNCVLRMDTFTLNNGKLYCIPHFKQLFITRGNYDEGFGVDPHKNKWTTTSSNSSTSPSPIAVSNGDL